MRKLFLIIASVFTILSIVFAFLPLGTLGLLPVGIALLFGFITLRKSNATQAKLIKVLLWSLVNTILIFFTSSGISYVSFIAILGTLCSFGPKVTNLCCVCVLGHAFV